MQMNYVNRKCDQSANTQDIASNSYTRRDFVSKVSNFLYGVSAVAGTGLLFAVLKQNTELKSELRTQFILKSHSTIPESSVKALAQIPSDWPTCIVTISSSGAPSLLQHRNSAPSRLSLTESILTEARVETFNSKTLPKITHTEVEKYITYKANENKELLDKEDISVSHGSGFLIEVAGEAIFVTNNHVIHGYRRGLELLSLQSATEDLAYHSTELFGTNISNLPSKTKLNLTIKDTDLVGQKVRLLVGGAEFPLEITGEVFHYEIRRGSELLKSQLALWTPMCEIQHPQFIPGGSGSPVVLNSNPNEVVAVISSYALNTCDFSFNFDDPTIKTGLVLNLVGPEALQQLANDWSLRQTEIKLLGNR
jgi:hypothetical protein